ncbi:MAG: flagellar basal-body MS-ring/collar protein FliF [Gudongella sp.]|nr:flagellar basal-body MS-ring/collar protein FliF [Gudongella sp.]
MAETIKNTFRGVKDGWEKIDSKKRRFLLFTVIIGIILILGITYATNKVNYAMLFNNLELDDAGRIVSDLETKNIKYKLENGGKTILIDSASVDNYRMDLAMQNLLPDSSTGFEIFDNTGLMVTDEDRQIMYQRALTGELQRSIVSLDAINTAKVHLVMPQKSIFDTEEKQGSASIIVDLKPNSKVTDSMVKGIASLVSGAVNNMPISSIQVIDSSGNLLSGFMQEDGTQNVTDVLDQYRIARNAFEKEIEGKLNSLLGSAFGYDKVKVSVLAELDFNSEESTIISYSNPVTRSEQVSASGEGMEYDDVSGGSIDDSISNVIEGDGEGVSSYSKVLNNELTTETKNIIKAPGMVEKLTTSVLYDGSLSEENRGNIQSIVAAAIGYDGDRGDVISVVGVRFNESAEGEPIFPDLESESGQQGFLELYKKQLIIGGGAFGALLLIGIIIMMVLGSKKRKKENRQFQVDIERGMTIQEATGEIGALEDVIIKPDHKNKKAQKYAQEHPELAADLIKSWVRE